MCFLLLIYFCCHFLDSFVLSVIFMHEGFTPAGYWRCSAASYPRTLSSSTRLLERVLLLVAQTHAVHQLHHTLSFFHVPSPDPLCSFHHSNKFTLKSVPVRPLGLQGMSHHSDGTWHMSPGLTRTQTCTWCAATTVAQGGHTHLTHAD